MSGRESVGTGGCGGYLAVFFAVLLWLSVGLAEEDQRRAPVPAAKAASAPVLAKPVLRDLPRWVEVAPGKQLTIGEFIPLKADQWYLIEFEARSSSADGGRYDFWITQRVEDGGWHSNNDASGYAFGMADDEVHHFELRYYMPNLRRRTSGLSLLGTSYYRALFSGEQRGFYPTGISLTLNNLTPLDREKTTIAIRNLTITPIAKADDHRHPPAVRKPFDGGRVRIDGLGNWELLEDGKWKPYFPLVMYPAVGNVDYADYKRNGWNTLTQISVVELGEKAAKAGLYYQIDFSGVFDRYGPNEAVRLLEAFKASPSWSRVVALYFDLENGTEFKRRKARAMVTALKKALMVDGKQEVPIIVNHLSPEGMIPFGDIFDVVGCYVNPVVSPWQKSSTIGTHLGQMEAFVTAVNSENMKMPVGIGTLNMPHEADHLETMIWTAIARGARGFGYWRDRYDDTDGTDIRRKKWFKSFPRHAALIQKALPIIRQPTRSRFRITMSEPEQEWGVIYGVREFKGRPVLIVVYQGSNLETTTKPKRVSFSTAHPFSTVRDVFTGKVVAKGENGRFSLTLKPYQYRLLYLQ